MLNVKKNERRKRKVKSFYRKKGFTLLELMIVVIIVGILASLALPRFIGAAKKAKESEAMNILGSIRAAQLRYYVEYNNYHVDGDLADGSALDLDITPSDYYTYSSLGPTPSDNAVLGQAAAFAGNGLDNYRIQQDGDIVSY